MAKHQICANCGTPLGENASEGLCPKCLLEVSFNSDLDEAVVADPRPDDSAPPLSTTDSQLSATPFGDYELLEEVGRGGMGIVYRARQINLNRVVAIKVLPHGPLASPEFVRRFRGEASAAGCLQHPNIVRIHEVGMHAGQHYIAMDFIEGRSLASLAANQPLPPRQAARYLKSIAEAIEYAHGRGIIHRDLKPSNVIVDLDDEPHVTDFGLAKRIMVSSVEGRESRADQASDDNGSRPSTFDSGLDLTVTGQLLGSPNFMPPEQASAQRGKVTKLSDIYSLGAVLYQLLTGRPPFAGATIAHTLYSVINSEPLAPRALVPTVPRDLETICLKCLEKEPAKRYASCQALAEDLTHFLRDEPIRARPITRPERAWRWCRRKPVIAALATSLVVVFVAGLAGVLTQWRRAANKSEENRRQVAQLNVLSGVQLMQAGDYFKSLLWFAEALRTDAGRKEREEIHRMRIAAVLQQCPRLVQVISHDGQPIVSAAFNATDDRLATVGTEDRTARVWEVPSGKLLIKTKRLSAVPYSVLFSPDGTRLLVILTDNTARILDAATGEQLGDPLPHRLEGASNNALFPAFDSTGQRLVTQTKEKELQVWHARTVQALGKPMLHTNKIERMQFNADGSLLFTRTEGPGNFAWDTETGELLPFPVTGPDAVGSFFMGPQADLALLGGRVWKKPAGSQSDRSADSLVRVNPSNTKQDHRADMAVRAPLLQPFGEPLVNDDWLLWAAFSPEGGRVLTASRDRTARVWDALTGKPLTPPIPHDQAVSRAEFSPDGHRVLTVSQDNLTRVWDADTGEPLTPPIPHATDAGASAFSSSGRYLLTVHPKYVACLWDLHQETSPPPLLKPLQAGGGVNEAAPRGGAFVSKQMDNLIRVRNTLGGLGVPLHPISVKTIPAQAWFDETSRFVLLEGELAKVQVWEAASGMPLTPQVQSRYALDEAASKQVKLATIDLPANDLAQLAQLLSGSQLDGRGGWTLLELEELNAAWERLAGKSEIRSQKSEIDQSLLMSAATSLSLLGPADASLTRWHRREAAAAEGASDWWAAAFHWQRLAALQPASPDVPQRLAYTLKCATNASAQSYRDRRRLIPPRDPRAGARQINLTEHYTAPITDGFSDARREVGLQVGLQTVSGVTFDVRGLIQLFGREPDLRHLKRPEQVTGIQIQQRATRLHLLHTEQWADIVEGEEIAALTIHYTNGQSERLPIEHAVHVAADSSGASAWTKQAEVAWMGTTALVNASQRALRLYKYTWPNPHPDWEIAQVDLASARTKASYVLVAMTVE